jgi:hypothetical protein
MDDAGVYEVRISNDEGEVKTSASLKVVASVGELPAPVANAGSSGTAYLPTGWWIYWAQATDSKDAETGASVVKEKSRNGYWLLERVTTKDASNKTVVTPGRASWVLGTVDTTGKTYALDATDRWDATAVSTLVGGERAFGVFCAGVQGGDRDAGVRV